MKEEPKNRSGHKRLAVMTAARRLFLDKGYDGASMDDVAAEAGVSKPTVYRYFADKEQLFTEVVSNVGQIEDLVRVVTETLSESEDLDKDLNKLARRLLGPMQDPDMLSLRRLVIGNAERFPAIGRSWYEKGFERVITALADCFKRLASHKRLRAEDSLLAAHQFTALLLWTPLNRAMYMGGPAVTESELDRVASDAVRAFLAAYGVHSRV